MLISIIIPAYDVENYIEECIHSAFAQIYEPIEVICVDNNSTDNTWQKLELLKVTYPQLIIAKEITKGAPAARNKGLALSKGEWIQFLDADDLLLPNKIQHQYDLLNDNTELVFIAGACIKRTMESSETIRIPEHNTPFKSLFSTNLGNTCSNLWNRRYLNIIRGWDVSLKSSQEADLMFRLLQINENVLYDYNPLTIIRERSSGQISQQNHSTQWERYFQKRFEMLQWISENRGDLYAQCQAFFYDELFGILRILAKEDLNKAHELHKFYLKGHYKPSKTQTHSTSSYLLLYKLLGFKRAETFRNLLGKK